MCKAIMLDDVCQVTGRFLYPTYIGVIVKNIKVANERCKGRCRCKDSMTRLTGDLIEHANEVKEEDDTG